MSVNGLNVSDHCENGNKNGYDDDENFETNGDKNENYENVLSDYIFSASVHDIDVENEFSAELNIGDYFNEVEISTSGDYNIVSRSRSRKKLGNKSHWKCEERKQLRNKGMSYTTRKGNIVKEQVLKSGCGAKCRKKCTDNFTEDIRHNIF